MADERHEATAGSESDTNALLCCPSCGGDCRVATSQSADARDSWRKHIVGCDGIQNPDVESDEYYIKEPCGLEITAFDDEREADDLIVQWNALPRT